MTIRDKTWAVRRTTRLAVTVLAYNVLIIGQAVLTNESVIKMVKGGLSADVIVDMIRSQPGKYSLTPDNMIMLKQQGVPDKVLSAMIARTSTTPPTSPSRPDERVQDIWEIQDIKDPLTGEPSVQASMLTNTDSNGRVEVRAKCAVDSRVKQLGAMLPNSGAHFLILRLSFLYSSDKNVVLKRSTVSQQIIRAPVLFGTRLGDDTITAPRSCVFMRVKVGNAGPGTAISEECDNDNMAAVSFLPFSARDLAQGMTQGIKNSGVLTDLLGAIADSNDPTVATVNEVFKADSLQVELPLSNGARRLVDIRPQDPSFKQFVARCESAFPVPPSSSTRPSSTRPELQYAGTAERFATALPGLVQRAAAAHRLDPTQYQRETAFIADVVRTCARITPQMAASVTDRLGHELFRNLGDQYKVCESTPGYASASDRVKTWNRETERGISYSIGSRNHWRDGFTLQVLFTALKSDPEAPHANSLADALRAGFNAQGIVAARIESSPQNPMAGTPLAVNSAPGPGASGTPVRAVAANTIRIPIPSGQARPAVRTESELLTALDNSIWIPDGAASDRQIYVIAGPCCGYSQDLYRNSRRSTRGVQFRWIEMAPTAKPKCLGYLAESVVAGDANLLTKMYETLAEPARLPTSVSDNTIRWNAGVEAAITPIIRALDPSHSTGVWYPTLIWLSKDGVRVAVRPARVDTIIDSVASRSEVAAIAPMARELATAEYRLEPIPPAFYGAKQEDVGVFVLPDPKAQLLFTLPKEYGFRGIRRTRVNGETWIEVVTSSEAWRPGHFVRETQVYRRK